MSAIYVLNFKFLAAPVPNLQKGYKIYKFGFGTPTTPRLGVFCHTLSCAPILLETSALYKLFTYLITSEWGMQRFINVPNFKFLAASVPNYFTKGGTKFTNLAPR